MNLFADIRSAVLSALDALEAEGVLPAGLDRGNVAVEPPRDAAHGDMATNAAMVLAKPAGRKPRDIAEALAPKLADDPRITTAEVAGPGFLNLRLSEDTWRGVVMAVLAQGADYGRSDMGAGRKINVEYVSANPTGPLHVGHTRGAVFGDALASLLEFSGHTVTREYYINDGGAQVDVLARSVYLRYLEAHGQAVAFEDGTYPGDYLKPVGEALKARVGDKFVDKGEQFWLAEVRDFATEAMMELIRSDLSRLGIKMDVFFSEKSLYGTGRIEAAIDDLDGKGLIYQGVLEPPKGKTPEDWEPREQTLFKSTEYGDDVDRPIKKSDGSWTYFAPDIAYHYDKISRGFDELIDVFGADHGGYVKRMKAAVAALSEERVPVDIKLCQLVKLWKNGEPFKMSKRAGTFVTLSDVVEAVEAGADGGPTGSDKVRFMMLMRKNDAPLDFDVDKVSELSKDNPVSYVQYAHTRVKSNERNAAALGLEAEVENLSAIVEPEEFQLIAKLAEWPRAVEIAAKAHEPHRIAFYLYELAGIYNPLYTQGMSERRLRVIDEGDPVTTTGKLALDRAVSVVISAGLGILGVTPAERM